MKRFVPLNPIVTYELPMFKNDEQCQKPLRFCATKTAHTIVESNKRHIKFRPHTLRIGTKLQRFLDKEKSITRQIFNHIAPKLVQK